MASNLSQRILTGIFGVSLITALLIYGGPLGALLFAGLVSTAMIYEFSGIVFGMKDRRKKQFFLVFLSLLNYVAFWYLPGTKAVIAAVDVLLIFVGFLFLAKYLKEKDLGEHFRELCYSLAGFSYVVFLFVFLFDIREFENGMDYVFLCLLIVWSADTGAYFAGKNFGKHKLYSLISPKKTIEGAIGGIILSIVVALFYASLRLGDISLAAIAITALAVNLASQFGDLAESLMKRGFGKKDSGSILPGHGGFLDRFDGVVFALPVMYISIIILF